MPTFTDVAHARLEVISFFAFGYLLLAWIYQLVWNSLGKDFPNLPMIRYRGALGSLIVCGLFVYVVLTMISGARELMTPGAWSRSGAMYRLREPERDPQRWLDAARRASLERLQRVLWSYADRHGGSFPASREAEDFPTAAWTTVDPDGARFAYLPGSRADEGQEVVAYEPAGFGSKRWALLSNGEILTLAPNDLTARIQSQFREAEPQRAP